MAIFFASVILHGSYIYKKIFRAFAACILDIAEQMIKMKIKKITGRSALLLLAGLPYLSTEFFKILSVPVSDHGSQIPLKN